MTDSRPDPTTERPRVPARLRAGRLAVLAAAYFLTAKLGLLLAFENESITAVWPPTGVALAALVLWGRGMWPGVAAGALAANLTTGAPLGSVLGIAAGNTLQAVLGLALLGALGFHPALTRVRDVFAIAAAALAGAAAGATIGVGSLYAGGALGAEGLGAAWRTWWLGDASGVLLAGALLLTLAHHARAPRSGSLAAPLASFAGLLVLAVAVFSIDAPVAYAIFPPIVWIALRHRQRGATAAATLVAGVGIWLTARGHGPFSPFSPDARLLASQAFADVLMVTSLTVAALRTGWLQATADLTARRRAGDTFRQLLEAAPDAMVIVDEHGRVVLVNAQAEDLFGYRREEILGRSVELLVPERLRRRHAGHRTAFAAAPGTRPMGRELELCARRKDGTEIPVEVSLSPLETAEGRLALSTIRDITDRRSAEQRIRESAARMSEAQEIARFGSWEWTLATGELVWSDVLYDIYGVTPGEFAPSFEAYLERLHPEDREPMSSTVARAVAEGRPFTFEERIVRPDGTVRLLRSQGRPMLDADGAVVRMVGVCQDVTELRDAEAARREAEARFRNAFENAPIGVALVALGEGGFGEFLEVNRSFCRITGFSEEELRERTLDSLADPRDLDADRPVRRQLLAGTRESYSTEWRCLCAHGEPTWALVNVSLVRDAGDEPRYAIVQLQDISDRKRFEGQLRQLADHDALTGLVNRRRFLEELDHMVEHHDRYGGRGAVLVLDLDHFKYINDTLGHAVGDDLLQRVGGLLRERLRTTDVVARLGGDEFAVLLPETDPDRAHAVAAELLRQIRTRAVVVSGGRRMRVTASIGIAIVERGAECSGEAVLVNADIAMYEAKEAGRNRAALLHAHEEPRTRMQASMTWSQRIRAALDNDGFLLYEQPIVDLRGGGEPRSELLVRMIGDNGEVVPPGSFLPVAEQFGLIQALDAWVVRRAIAIATERQRAGMPGVLEVNLSGASVTDPAVLDVIEAEIAASGVDPRRLVFEVTETAAIVNIERANRFARRLADLGCGFALDDFGAGFGSFYYLKHLPFDHLKIDGDFIRNLPRSEADQLTVKAIVQIAQGMGKETVAEFVGDRETLDLLRAYGVDYAQGYHLGRPEPVARVPASVG